MKSQTEQNFITAFWKISEQKHIDKISIRELCDYAGYNRSTFYDHFQDIYDLFDHSISLIFSGMQEHMKRTSDFLLFINSEYFVQLLLEQLKQNYYYIKIIIKNHQEYYLKQHFLEILQTILKEQYPNISLNYTILFALEYHISGCIGMIMKWIQTPESFTDEMFIQTLYSIAKHGMIPTLQKAINCNS